MYLARTLLKFEKLGEKKKEKVNNQNLADPVATLRQKKLIV